MESDSELSLKTSYKKKAANKKRKNELEFGQKRVNNLESDYCVSMVIIKQRKRAWMRDRTIAVAFPGPMHLNSKTKSNRRSFGTGTDESDQSWWNCEDASDSETEEESDADEDEDTKATKRMKRIQRKKHERLVLESIGEDGLVADKQDNGEEEDEPSTARPQAQDEEPLQAVNIVCRARLSTKKNRSVMSTDMAKRVFFGKCQADEFPATSISVRLNHGRNPTSYEERFPLLAWRTFGRPVAGPPKHSTVSVSYCASGSHGIAGSENCADSLQCITLIGYHLWMNLAVPLNVRSFTAVNITAKATVGSCIDLVAFGKDYGARQTNAHKIVQTSGYPGTRIALDRPFDQMACMCSQCQHLYSSFTEAEDPRNYVFVPMLGSSSSQRRKMKGNGDAKLVMYDTGSYNIAGLKNVYHFILASYFIHLFVKQVQLHYPLSNEERAKRHAPKRARTSAVIDHSTKSNRSKQ